MIKNSHQSHFIRVDVPISEKSQKKRDRDESIVEAADEPRVNVEELVENLWNKSIVETAAVNSAPYTESSKRKTIKEPRVTVLGDLWDKPIVETSATDSIPHTKQRFYTTYTDSISSKGNMIIEPKMKMEEVVGDLFMSNDQSESLCHCVSEDLSMSKGIAVLFKDKFGGISSLKMQKAKIGKIAMLSRDNRFIYCLITKAKYWQKPTIFDLERSLQSLRIHCENNNVSQLSMPRIGCGLDRFKWSEVKQLIISVFKDLPIRIKVFQLP
jgi:hypothetical protein